MPIQLDSKADGSAAFRVNGNEALTFATNGAVGGALPFSFRNKIINGNFDVWQRSAEDSNGFLADRFRKLVTGSTLTQSRQFFTAGQTDVPNEPASYWRGVVSSVAGVGNRAVLLHPIENVRTFAGKTVTLSWYARADAVKNMAVEISQTFGTGGTPSADVQALGVTTVALGTTWAKYTATVAIPPITGKTLGSNGDSRIYILFWFDAGSSFDARTASLGQQSGTFDIAQVQLEEGSVATPFEQRPEGLELMLCQRYCRPLIASLRFPAAAANQIGSTGVHWPSMRATPTISGVLGSENTNNLSGTPTFVTTTPEGSRFQIIAAAAGDTFAVGYRYLLTAEL